jgi:hypothetical protein
MTQQGHNRAQRRSGADAGSRRTAVERAEARYVRSTLCRVIRVDGGHGGLTAQGAIHLGIYAERTVTPDMSVYVLDTTHRTVTEQPQRPSRTWVREVEADLILTRESARAIRNWLDLQLKRIDSIEAEGGTFESVQQSDTGEA